MNERVLFHDQRAVHRSEEGKRWYHHLLRSYYCFVVPPGATVLELGCGLGDLLSSVQPSRGVGVDFSPTAVEMARKRHPGLEFLEADAAKFQSTEQFDYILISDLVNDLEDVQTVLKNALEAAHPRTRLVLNSYNFLWRPILAVAERMGLKAPTLPQNWLSSQDLVNLLSLSGWELVRQEKRILWPLPTPLWEVLWNRLVAPLVPPLALAVFQVARPCPRPQPRTELTCSIVIPARNEAGNIEQVVRRTPILGQSTELIFVEGHSADDTWAQIERVQAAYPEKRIRSLKQPGRGKGDAVRAGFEAATGDLLFILDADLTVAPEELPKFYEAARDNIGELINGVRLVYPMENRSMQWMNMLANKLFSLTFTWLLGQPVKDTLCGTKVLSRRDYEAIAKNRAYFGDFDPFGDFDLLFGASKLNLKIVDLPIRYRARTYGSTNIQRWRHGWLLLRMIALAARRLKFV